MLKKLIVPLDGSAAAEIVLPYAEEIAAKSGSGMTLVMAIGPEPKDPQVSDAYLERVKVKMEAVLRDYGVDTAGRISAQQLKESPAEAINRYADETGADLIVMASRGSTSKGPWLLGSVASKVSMASSKPVLVVKKAAQNTAIEQRKIFKKIMVTLDGSPCGEEALPQAQELARLTGAELIIFHAVEPISSWVGYGIGAYYIDNAEPENVGAEASAYLKGIQNRLSETGLVIKTVLEEGSPADIIINYAKAEGVDAIVISTHGRSGVSRWVFGSVTEKVLQHGEPAVLVVHACKI